MIPPLEAMLTLAGILLVSWLIGSWCWQQLTPPNNASFPLLATTLLGIAILGWLAFTLAEFGVFSLANLFVTVALLILIAGIVGQQKPNPSQWIPTLAPSTQYAFLLLWLLVALWLFFRPHEYILGGADAGVYVSIGAHISRSGGILIQDNTLASLLPNLHSLLLRNLPPSEATPYYLFPGFYVANPASGQVIPQFYHLHPVWQAIVIGTGGIYAALLMNGLWGLLSCLALFSLVRQRWGWQWGLVALAGISLNVLQIWFSRYPTTEILTQYLLWSGLWALDNWYYNKKPTRLWGLLAGLLLGQLFLTRIDMYFLLALPAFLIIWRPYHRTHLWFYLPLALLTMHSFSHALWQSAPYFQNTFGWGIRLLTRNPAIPTVVLITLLMLAIIFRYVRHMAHWQPSARYRTVFWGAIIASICLLTLYAAFLRPTLMTPLRSWADWYGGQQLTPQDRLNLIKLSWYVPPFTLTLALAGCCLLLWQFIHKPDIPLLLIIGTGLFFTAFYIWRIQANPQQIYSMRRFVPAFVPCTTLCTTAFFIHWHKQVKLPPLWKQTTLFLLIALWLGSLAWAGRGFIRQVDHATLTTQLAQLNATLPSNSILIFNDPAPVGLGDFIGTPLQYIYGQTAYTIRQPDLLVDPPTALALQQIFCQWHTQNRSIFWIGATDWLEQQNLPHHLLKTPQITTSKLESTPQKPQALVYPQWTLPIAQLTVDC